MDNELTRRDFLLGSAACSMGLVATTCMTGCASQADAEEANPEPLEFYDCDFVVAGTGTTGLCAATHAAELGASVIVVEALTEQGLGGNSKYVEACWAPANKDVVEASYASLIEYHKGASNAIITRKWCDDALDILDWTMNSQGVSFAGTSGLESLKATSPAIKYAEIDDVSAGKAAILTMYEYAKELGVRFIFDARAIDLLRNDQGAVCGVICEHLDGQRLQVNAGAVDLCTGGYSANREMFERYTNVSYDVVIPYGTSGSQRGDGINMGLKLNALLHHPEAINYCSPVLPGHFNKGALVICGCNQADTLFFNEAGRRFCDEGCISDWALSGNAGCQQQKIFVIVDQDFVDKIMTEGPVTKRTNYFKANEPVPQFQDEIDKALVRDNPRVVKGDTIDDVCTDLELDAITVKNEIERFNGYVDAGYDSDFQKKPEWLRKIQTGPFYGFKTVLAFYNTVGGLKVDEEARVIGADYKPIPGLYAGGSDAGGLFGPCYDVSTAPGSTQMWARESGYWAAEHAVNTYLKTL